MRLRVTSDQIREFRLRRHGLAGEEATVREPGAALLEAAGRAGVQNSPPGAALLSFAARVQGLSPELLDRAVERDLTLVQSWSMRGAPYVFPAADAAIFTTGVLPPTEEAARRFVPGVVPALDRLGLSLGRVTDLLAAELPEVLRGRRLDIHALGSELAPRLEPHLDAAQLTAWRAAGRHAPGQSRGEAVVHFAVRLLTLRGLLCIAPRTESRAQFVLVHELLGERFSVRDPALARAELLRRYLRISGPATRADFAAWVGVGARDAAAWWELCADELVPVDTALGTRWILAADAPVLAAQGERSGTTDGSAAAIAAGVQFLPASDPYLRQPDREITVPRTRHGDVWRTVGAPGVVLRDGHAVATWRARLSGRSLDVSIEPWRAVAGPERERISDAAQQLARLRGAQRARVTFA